MLILLHKAKNGQHQLQHQCQPLIKGRTPFINTMVAQIDRPTKVSSQSLSVPSEVRGLLYNKEITAKVLSWDSFSYGTESAYKPGDIEAVSINEDIVWYRIGDGAVPISIDQFVHYWEQIQAIEKPSDELSTEMIVELAKSSGIPIWEQGCKLGYVVRIKSDYYAVTEVLTYGKGFQYSHSRHGSFQLACDALVEQSWVEEVA